MKKEIASAVLAVLIMGLILPGCAQSQVNELKAQIAELKSENERLVEENLKLQELKKLKSENERLVEENLKLQKEVNQLEERTTAKMEITFEPDPVPLKEGEWRWQVTLKEIKGFGVKLDEIIVEVYGGDELLHSSSDKGSDNSWLEAMDYYLPAYGEADSERHIPYKEEAATATHVVFVVTGVDDNGHSIAAENKIELLPKKPGSAKIEITFSANPLPCENGYWTWRTIYTEVSGIGVTFNNIKGEMYRNTRLLHTSSHDRTFIAGKLPDAYLPAYGSVDWGGHIPCQNITHIVKTMSGIDDNGNEITAEARLDFKR